MSSDRVVRFWPEATPSRADERYRALGRRLFPMAAAAAGATAILLATTGFRFGVSDNHYQIPLALNLPALPQFAHDPYYQHLNDVVSYVWPLERLVATPGDLHALFLVSYIAAASLLFAALLAIIRRLAAPGPLGMGLAATVLGLAAISTGYAFLSGNPIIPGYFTQDGVAIALAAAALALALSGRMVAALPLVALAFDAEPGPALWCLPALAGIALVQRRDGHPMLREWLVGLPVAVLLALPAIVWWLHALARGGVFHGDLFDWLTLLEPNHYLVWTAPLKHWVLFVATLVLALTACSVLGPGARRLRAALLGLLAVFALGCVLPFLTHVLQVLAFRPLGADALLQMLAGVAALSVVLRDLREARDPLRVGFAVLIVAGLVLTHYLLPLAALAMLARAALGKGEMLLLERRVPAWRGAPLHVAAALLLLPVLAAGLWLRAATPRHWTEPAPLHAPGFVALTAWARQETPRDAVFLVNGAISGDFNAFQMFALRRVWQDDRSGASVMWDPAYYSYWQPRVAALWRLRDPAERLAFACRVGADFYADHAGPALDLDNPGLRRFVAFRAGGYFVIDARRYCAAH